MMVLMLMRMVSPTARVRTLMLRLRRAIAPTRRLQMHRLLRVTVMIRVVAWVALGGTGRNNSIAGNNTRTMLTQLGGRR